MNYLETVVELIDEGIIVVDSQGLIRVYNKLAREMFGIDHHEGIGHREGRVADGDIVCVADNMLGADDGGMLPEDLGLIGVDPCGVEQGDAVVVIGIKGAPKGTGLLRVGKKDGAPRELWVKTCLRGLELESKISFELERLRISVNGRPLDYVYRWAAGHMVVVDAKSGEIKFHQTRGYTARREELKTVLLGAPFKGKGRYASTISIVGRHVSELHPDSPIIDQLIRVASGSVGAVRNMETLINGIPVRCSIEPLPGDSGTGGALLKVVDVSELKALHLEKKSLGKWRNEKLSSV
ncbi:MAG: PAS domain-containing protein [Bacillota bacterium]